MSSFKKQLNISVGQCSLAGKKATNDDCLGVRIPAGDTLKIKGAAAIIADGVSAASGGKEAAEMCVQGFLTDYYSTPDAWSVKNSCERVINALNRWLYAQSYSHGLTAEKGYVSTMSSLVIVAHTAYILHIGDSRIYRYRQGSLELLTRDHVSNISNQSKYLNRAMGLNLSPQVDFQELDVELGDIFLFTTDGVHEWLTDQDFTAVISENDDLELAAKIITDQALESGSNDNVSTLVLRVDCLDDASRESLLRSLAERPFPPLLYPGQTIDGLEVEKVLFESARSQLYKVKEVATGEVMVMKTPSHNFSDDPDYIERFIAEEWIGKRVSHQNLLKVYDRETRPSFLYHVMEYVEGKSLQQWLKDHDGTASVKEVVAIIKQVIAGVRSLHRMETIHQDLKLDNILILPDGSIKVIDYGSCRIANRPTVSKSNKEDVAPGTLEFGAPEYRHLNAPIGYNADQFSIAVIAYKLLSNGESPYEQHWEKANTLRDFQTLKYISLYNHNPHVPHWIDGVIKKALKINPDSRYASMSELSYDLEHPNAKFTETRHLPYIERDPLKFWKTTTALLALLSIGLIIKILF